MRDSMAGIEREQAVAISVGGFLLHGDLTIPRDARGLVIFAQESGSSRLSPRNRHVAEVLQRERLGTLLLDLLTAAEEMVDERTGHLRFDIPLLATRLVGASDWAAHLPLTRGLPVGYFGASTGAAAALVAAAHRPDLVAAVVSRGGRPDLAGVELEHVRAPTLLIVGGHDPVIGLNQIAMDQLPAPARLELVPGANHLFEEPGALEQVAHLAAEWFVRFLPAHGRPLIADSSDG